jgi:hypothetical protein
VFEVIASGVNLKIEKECLVSIASQMTNSYFHEVGLLEAKMILNWDWEFSSTYSHLSNKRAASLIDFSLFAPPARSFSTLLADTF